jgi:glutaredoxin-related protein
MPAHPPVHPAAKAAQESYFPEVVAEVAAAVAKEPVVVVGVAWNQPAKKAREALDAAGIRYRYLEYGNYLNGWRMRVALKLWAGWPTFPQVYVKGALIGGARETRALIKSGELQTLLGSA